MPRLYENWENNGARFHYVSGSPKQLYTFIHEFIRKFEFPTGSMHLRDLRMRKDSIEEFISFPDDFKLETIREIIARFPLRQFILVGDSGEKDIEVYSKIFCEFPQQIKHIYIRDINYEVGENSRFKEECENIPDKKWSIFKDPLEIRSFENND